MSFQSIFEVQQKDIHHLFNCISAILNTHQAIHKGFFHHNVIEKKVIKDLENKVNEIEKNSVNLPHDYFQLLSAIYSFYSALNLENECQKYLHNDLQLLLADKLKNLQESAWETYEDNQAALCVLESALTKKKHKKVDETWCFLEKNLLSDLENDTANQLALSFAFKIGLQPQANLSEDYNKNNDKKSNKKSEDLCGVEWIVNKSKQLQSSLNIDINLLKEIKSKPYDHKLKKQLIHAILTNEHFYRREMSELYEFTKKFKSRASTWNIENLNKLCVATLKQYDAKKSPASIDQILTRLTHFICCFVDNVINPLDEIFGTKNYCDDLIIRQQQESLRSEFSKMIEEKEADNSANKTPFLPKNDDRENRHFQNAHDLLQVLYGDKGMTQEIRLEIWRNKYLVLTLSACYLYLKKYPDLRSGTFDREQTELFVNHIINLRFCPKKIIQNHALQFIQHVGNYSALLSWNKMVTSKSRLKFLLETQVIDKEMLSDTRLLKSDSVLKDQINLFFADVTKTNNANSGKDSRVQNAKKLVFLM